MRSVPSYQLYVLMLDVAHGWLASAKFMVDVDLVLCFSTLHISVWSAGEISTWYQWASWFVEKILHMEPFATMMKAINIQKTKKILQGNPMLRYENFDESLKKMKTLDNGYLWEMCQHVCRMLIPTGRCHDEEPSRKVWFDLVLCFDFLNNIWISSCRATYKYN